MEDETRCFFAHWFKVPRVPFNTIAEVLRFSEESHGE